MLHEELSPDVIIHEAKNKSLFHESIIQVLQRYPTGLLENQEYRFIGNGWVETMSAIGKERRNKKVAGSQLKRELIQSESVMTSGIGKSIPNW